MVHHRKASRLGFKSLKARAGHLFALSLFSIQLHAQAGGTANIEIDFPPLIILYFFGDIKMDISTADLAGIVTGRSGDTAIDEDADEVTVSAFSQDLSIPGTKSFISPSVVHLDFFNYWGVRAIANSGGADVRVTVTLKNGSLKGPGSGNTLTINSVSIRSGTDSGSFANYTDITPAGVGTLIRGDVRLEIDLSAVSREGIYSGGDFAITAVSL